MMGKKNVMVSIDEDLHKEAKERFLNVSALTEIGIRTKIKEPEVKELIKCEFCGNEGKLETPEEAREAKTEADLKGSSKPLDYSEPTSLTWLANYQQWICNSCLRQAIKKLTIK